MTSLPDEAVQAAARAHTPQFGNMDETIQKYALEQMRAALTAALPFLQGVKVKGLEWKTDRADKINGVDTERNGFHEFGYYSITGPSNCCHVSTFDNMGRMRHVGHHSFASIEAAKAAAQADYEARILSAIEASTLDQSPAPAKRDHRDCVCTTIQQDEHCIVGYPSLLCEICGGKGVVPYVKLDGPELWEIVFGIANEVAHEISDEQYAKIADAINSVFINPIIPAPEPSPRAQALEELLSDDMLKDISTEFISWKGENPYKVDRGGCAAWEVEAPAIKAALSLAIRSLSQPVADGVDSIEVTPSSGCVFADMGVERPVADGWLPIETAPKDGSTVLIAWQAVASVHGEKQWFQTVAHYDDSFEIAGYNEETGDAHKRGAWTDGAVASWAYEEVREISPTHWRPLPTPPEAAK